MKKVMSFFIKLLVLVCLGYYAYAYLGIRFYRTNGTSMSGLLNNGEIVVSKKENNLKRGDIIVYYDGHKNVIKRIVGLPNEIIDIKTDGKIYINDNEYHEDYIGTKNPKGEVEYPHTISNNSYFCLGDNRLDSYDSRYLKVGDINSNIIKGRVIFSISTFRIIKRINN